MDTQTVRAVSVGDWVVTLLITALPLIGFIMLFVWAFSDGTPASKANWAKALLIWYAFALVISLLLFLVFGLTMGSLLQGWE